MVLTRRQAASTEAAASAVANGTMRTGPSDKPPKSEPEPDSQSTANATTATPATSAQNEARPKKSGDFFKRLFSGLALTFLFYGVVRGGHIPIWLAIILMEIGMFHEILRLGMSVARDRRIPLWRTTGWYFFMALIFLFYGKPVLSHFEDQGMSFTRNAVFQYALKHHSFLSFCVYCAGFVGFVLSLKQDQYHFQFTYFGRALVALILVVVQSHFMILNVTQGLIWFILPCWLIICNDSFGYFCGRLFGRHALTALSPKKTWEGYIGAGISTMIFAYFLSGWLSQFTWLVCPKYEFTDCSLICPPMSCDPVPEAFVPTTLEFTPIPGLTRSFSLVVRPVQLHSIALAFFASSIAPFGGFFASGAKRAFGIKDFGAILPGHGGVTDRVDCQLMMAVFTFVYTINFVKVNFVGSPDVGKLMSFVAELSTAEQIELLTEMYTRLKRRGVDDLILNSIINATNTRR